MVARRLLGEGCELRIFDAEVQLPRLLGANRSYIDAHIPHFGSLSSRRITSSTWSTNLPNRNLRRCHYEGICW